jgi:homoserine dehydrogenase
MKIIDVALVGVGSVGRNLLTILETRGERIARDHGLALRVVLAADSSGVALNPTGFDAAALRTLKESGGHLRALPAFVPGLTPAQALAETGCALLFEASPVNLTTGDPGLSAVRAALAQGTHAVLANKAPLVLAFHELHDLAQQHGARLAFSATVCGALPVINLLQRDLPAAEIPRLRGIFNSTSNFILGEMESGRDYADALAEAQRRGLAETDPSLDVDGWDTANKLVIIANAGLGIRATLADVAVEGIRGLAVDDLLRARAEGNAIKLLATAERRDDGSYALQVAPTALPAGDFLGACDSWEMGVEIQSDLYGRWYHKIWEREPLPTAAAMLRDALNIYR